MSTSDHAPNNPSDEPDFQAAHAEARKPAPPRSNAQRAIWAVLAVAMIGVGAFSLSGWLKGQELKTPVRKLEVYGKIPEFSLTDQDGKAVTRKDFDGHFWLADLIFTNCEGTCPMLTARMATIQKSLVKTPDVKILSVSVDPTNDTQEALKAYAANYGADTKTWAFTRGPVSTVFSLAKEGFHLPVDSANVKEGTPIIHSERFVLVDKQGQIRGYYDGTADDVKEKVLMDLGDLMREERAAE